MEFLRPQNVEEAVKMAQRPGSQILAGGTDLVLQLKEGKIKPDAVIDLGKLPELRQIQAINGYLEIGSMVSFTELGKSELVHDKALALYLAAQTMGSPQIRNQATLGGNLGNCSPAADGLPPLLALGAKVCIRSADGEESVPLSVFMERSPLLAPGSIITKFMIPLAGWHSGFAKLGRRRALAIARLSVAIAVEVDGEQAKSVRVALGAVGKRAFVAESLGQALSNQVMDEEWVEKAVAGAKQLVREALGSRASAPYKRVAVGGVVRQAIESGMGKGGELDGNQVHG